MGHRDGLDVAGTTGGGQGGGAPGTIPGGDSDMDRCYRPAANPVIQLCWRPGLRTSQAGDRNVPEP